LAHDVLARDPVVSNEIARGHHRSLRRNERLSKWIVGIERIHRRRRTLTAKGGADLQAAASFRRSARQQQRQVRAIAKRELHKGYAAVVRLLGADVRSAEFGNDALDVLLGEIGYQRLVNRSRRARATESKRGEGGGRNVPQSRH